MNRTPFVQVEAAFGYLLLPSQCVTDDEFNEHCRQLGELTPLPTIPRKYPDWPWGDE